MSHDDKIERYEKGKWWSFGKMPVRAYGSSAKLPSEWIQGFYIIVYPRGLYYKEQGKLTLNINLTPPTSAGPVYRPLGIQYNMYKVVVWNLIWASITIIRKGHEMT